MNLLGINKKIFNDDKSCKAFLGKRQAELDDNYIGPNQN